nr:MAG TPA: hypothetical protein [Caudoviricetes sp.]
MFGSRITPTCYRKTPGERWAPGAAVARRHIYYKEQTPVKMSES